MEGFVSRRYVRLVTLATLWARRATAMASSHPSPHSKVWNWVTAPALDYEEPYENHDKLTS